MNQYLQRLARRILKIEIDELRDRLSNSSVAISELSREKEKLQKKAKRLERPENILISYYRIDNIGSNGMPPSYLNPENPNEYTQRIHELESIYRNSAFREMMAWALNFHANICASGKITNELGDEIDIPTEHAKYMIDGIKSIWDLVVAAHLKDQELTVAKTGGVYDILDTTPEEVN